jgi:hypothetical protein
MTDRRYSPGEKALISRDQSGENHEEATVVDYYVMLIGEDTTPTIVVDFEDGQRAWLTAREPNVLPLEPEEEEGADDPEASSDEDDAAESGDAGAEETAEDEPDPDETGETSSSMG